MNVRMNELKFSHCLDRVGSEIACSLALLGRCRKAELWLKRVLVIVVEPVDTRRLVPRVNELFMRTHRIQRDVFG